MNFVITIKNLDSKMVESGGVDPSCTPDADFPVPTSPHSPTLKMLSTQTNIQGLFYLHSDEESSSKSCGEVGELNMSAKKGVQVKTKRTLRGQKGGGGGGGGGGC